MSSLCRIGAGSEPWRGGRSWSSLCWNSQMVQVFVTGRNVSAGQGVARIGQSPASVPAGIKGGCRQARGQDRQRGRWTACPTRNERPRGLLWGSQCRISEHPTSRQREKPKRHGRRRSKGGRVSRRPLPRAICRMEGETAQSKTSYSGDADRVTAEPDGSHPLASLLQASFWGRLFLL